MNNSIEVNEIIEKALLTNPVQVAKSFTPAFYFKVFCDFVQDMHTVKSSKAAFYYSVYCQSLESQNLK